MKQNQKGFTLIELLAVIVILAIIALIATPIILGVVNDSRMKAAEDSAYGVVKSVQLAISESQITDNPQDSAFIDFSESNRNVGTKVVRISGTEPTEGTVAIDSQGNVTVSNLKINNYYCNGTDKITCSTTPKTGSGE